jgi:hypothetical protein
LEGFREDLEVWVPEADREPETHEFDRYQLDPVAYAWEQLGLRPWPGTVEKGQLELCLDIAESVRLQLGGEKATKVFRVEAGNGLGKTYFGAMLVNWFFDAFSPSVTITTAPTRESVEQLLWKDIKAMRPHKLSGRVLPSDAKMIKSANHFAVGKATNDARGSGEERFKGQHPTFQMFVLDEAEGLAKFVFDAVHRMMTGSRVSICLMLANPKTRTSEFFKWKDRAGVASYRLSALDHPNVLNDSHEIPGATDRAWVDGNIDLWCEEVRAASADDYTFSVAWRPGIVYKPNHEFLCAVMGIPPANSSDDTLIPSGRYDAAVLRGRAVVSPSRQVAPLRIGVDVARWGLDSGTVYARCNNVVWRVAKLSQKETDAYVRAIRTEALKLLREGVCLPSLHVRVDAGGGWGSGVIDALKRDEELRRAFKDFRVLEVNNNGRPHTPKSYANLVTEMYADVSESLLGLSVLLPATELGPDLTERKYGWKNVKAVSVKVLEEKDEVRKPNRLGRSPDDGDGFCLAVASDFVFVPALENPVTGAMWAKAGGR